MEENKELDNFIRKSIKEIGLEEPSADFTNLVLSKIQTESERGVIFKYQPILSKSTWLVILAMETAIFAYVIFGNPGLENTWFSFSRLNGLAIFNLLGKIPHLDVSNTFVYGILIFAFFVVVQVFMIKQRFDRGFDLR